MSTPYLLFLRHLKSTVTVAMFIVGLSVAGYADTASVNMTVWKMKYGVTDTQANDPLWLAKDDDSDGIKNGDELAAGTNPFSAGSVVKITSITADATNVVITFPTEDGKQYVTQGASSLAIVFPATAVNWIGTGVNWIGTGVPKTLTVPKGSNKFFRVLVQDVHTDGDQTGVSDWAKKILGYNINTTSRDGITLDKNAIPAALSAMNQVTVTATKPNATQPADNLTAPVEVGSVTVSRGLAKLGSLLAPDITVNLQKVGTAVQGTDYDSIPDTVIFHNVAADKVVSQQVFTINPRYNSGRRSNVTAIVKAVAGTGYTVGSAASGSVVINAAGLTDGTGLTANYWNTSSVNYSSGAAPLQTTIFTGSAQMSRTDAVIDFGTSNTIASISLGNPCTVVTGRDNALALTGDSVTIAGVTGGTFSLAINGTFAITRVNSTTFTIPVNCTALPTSVLSATVVGANGWGTTAGPNGMSSASTTGAYSIRWTGQVLPQYSENYFFDFRSDDGAKVWVNGVLLIDKWQSQSSTDWVNSISLTAGVLYDIQIDYLNISGASEARLYWWSASQPKQIIPKSRLFAPPALSAKQTAVTNTLYAVGYELTVFTPLNVSTPNIGGTITYAVDANSRALPTGLTLNGTTGVISGTPAGGSAGTYNVAVNATNVAAGTVTGSSVINFTIFPVGSVTREKLVGSTIIGDGTILTVDDDTDYAAVTSRRLRGYIVPPKTGNYYFWLAANNTAELWISNNSEYVNRVKRASVTASTGKKVWNLSSTQQTQWLSLVAGQKYYFDILHNTPGSGADDYVQMGWCQDDIGTVPSVTGDPNPNGVTPVIPNTTGAALQGYPLSGTVPSYIFQPYDYPPVTPSTGTLYAANLGPQGNAGTKASGSANLQLDATQTQAILHFTYGNLSSPRTGYHLHTDAFLSHPAGEIIFDIDDIDANHPELRTADGGYIWNLVNVGTFTTIQQLRDAITGGKVYLNIHSVNFGAGEIRGNLQLVNGSQTPPDASVYAEPPTTDSPSNPAQAARFLNQATFGASPADITYLATHTFSQWIDDQLTKTASHSSNDVVAGITADINTPYPSQLFTDAWWKYSITGQDQLRQRLAFALSEILVVSWNNNTGPLQSNARILADYYDNMVDFCLPTGGLTDSGNFRGVLKSTTLTPAMGLYLDMRGNQKEDLSLGRHPNENYAREIMQLFSVGLNRTWDDGKLVLDSNAGLVPTYSQTSILGMAGLLTGWNYAQPLVSGRLPTNFGPAADYLNAMVLVPGQHDFVNPKLLLNNVVSPAATGLTPRVTLTSISSNVSTAVPCVVTTSTVHGLKAGDTVRISNVTSGTFSSPINAMLVVTNVVSPTTFNVGVTATSTSINCTVAPTAYTNAAVTGATVTPATYIGSIAAVTGSQFDSVGTTLPHPYDQYGMTELDRAIDNIVNNDNVPPYVCRQLIQRLVTSNPSPGYLYRVVQKFKDDGSAQHVRGNMVAVIRQILLDGEARSYTAAAANAQFGKQREPMLRLTGTARAFPATNYSGTYSQLAADTVNANKLRIATSIPNSFSGGFTVALNFQGNYTSTVPPNPSNNPTSTTYAIGATLPIAQTHLDVTGVSTGGTPTTITTAQAHGLPGPTNQVWFFGMSGVFNGATPNSGAITATQTGLNTFTVPINTTTVFQVTNVAVGANCVVTTAAAHGLAIGSTTTGVTINGVTGGTFVGSINSSTLSVVGTDATHFTVTGVTCSSPPTSYTTWRECSNPCLVITQVPHGLTTGDSVTIASVSGGSFTPTINGTFTVTVFTPSSFTIASSCASPSTPNTGNIVGGNTMDVPATGMVNVTYSQPANSTIMTVNTGGPQTDVIIPVPNSATTTLKSKVYLDFLQGTSKLTSAIASVAPGNPCAVTTATPHGLLGGEVVTISGVSGGTFTPTINSTYTVAFVSATQFTVQSNCTLAPTAATGTVTQTNTDSNFAPVTTPADGVYSVDTANGTTSFTVVMPLTTAARAGNVIVPKITTSYTPVSSNNVVQYNCNVNHNMVTGDHVWVDAPVVGTPVSDAEYVITAPITGSGILPVDEDHFQTSYLPVSSGLGTYPKPSGSNNGITIFPLFSTTTSVADYQSRWMSRSGSVTINQSTFSIGATDSSLTQSPLNAPTVFNYFFPNYKFPGTLEASHVDSPEFQLTTDTNISNLTNSLTNMFLGTGGGNGNVNGLSSFNNGGGSVVIDIGNLNPANGPVYLTAARTGNGGIDGLIFDLASILVGGPLENSTTVTISTFVRGKVISAISTGNPCTITSVGHRMVTGSTVTISGVTGGTFSPAINGTYVITVPLIGVVPNQVPDPDHFTVPVNCTVLPTSVAGAFADHFPMSSPTPTNSQMRDRIRAIIHLIITSAEFAVQK